MYRIERIVGLTHARLERLLTELHDFGLLDGGLVITDQGYRFLTDISNKVFPVLRMYGLWDAKI